MDRKTLGKLGEDEACRYYLKLGYRILERNYAIRGGEVDIIAGKDKALVFVEVKTRISDRFGLPEESVGSAKETALRRSVNMYLSSGDYAGFSWQIDLIAITMDEAGKILRFERFENIFS